MGSGETSPTMVRVHRCVVALARPSAAVLLESPYGFQENAADISTRAQGYFARSVDLRVGVPPGLRTAQDPAADRGVAALRSADWVFAGPGSPSYALGLWRGGPVGAALADHARTGRAVLVFASAAACTLGLLSLPVYEVYKAGYPPHWLAGLDVLGRHGLKVAVIPHYDNTEGGTHDTRYCYLGERRLRLIERELPDDAAVLGVDERTAVVIDADNDRVEVHGRGGLTVRRRGGDIVVPTAETIALSELRSLVRGTGRRPARRQADVPERPAPRAATLRDAVLDGEERFKAAERGGEAGTMVQVVLDIETAVAAWAADTEEDEGADWARNVVRSLIVRLGQAAARGFRDPHRLLEPAIQPLVDVRNELRGTGLYGLADRIREALTAAGIELRDTPYGSDWRIRTPRPPGTPPAADGSPADASS
ncbi:hypothetical protein ACFFNX_04015 [Actinoallomurus acaciae]|uniref:Cysteinyl-tRNA synthetase n=2 Tax=Actinoallomurus acaciae TaxID=502577 RepID=A0ABV5YAZ0_9ACTN